jgi:hypothetical protein
VSLFENAVPCDFIDGFRTFGEWCLSLKLASDTFGKIPQESAWRVLAQSMR